VPNHPRRRPLQARPGSVPPSGSGEWSSRLSSLSEELRLLMTARGTETSRLSPTIASWFPVHLAGQLIGCYEHFLCFAPHNPRKFGAMDKRMGELFHAPKGQAPRAVSDQHCSTYLPLRNRVHRKLEHLPPNRRCDTTPGGSGALLAPASLQVPAYPPRRSISYSACHPLSGHQGSRTAVPTPRGGLGMARMPSTRRPCRQHRRRDLPEPGSVSVG
jgi:hypothetical protein